MVARIKVALLMGGRSTEREVSLASGREILDNLNPDRYEVATFDPAAELSRLVAEVKNFDVAFPALHGPYGEDGTIQGLLDLLELPYVGSGVLASALCMDKNATKAIYRSSGLPVSKDLLSNRGKDPYSEADRAARLLGLPVVVKPLNQGSSVGLTIAQDRDAAARALEDAWRLYPVAMLERYVPGRELTCAVLGNSDCRALPPIEIVPGEGHGFFDYQAKYVPGQAQEICPAPLSGAETGEICWLAVKAHQALGCRGLSRTDFILDVHGAFHLLETNTLPGFTSNSLLPKAAKAAGMGFPALLDELIRLALEND